MRLLLSCKNANEEVIAFRKSSLSIEIILSTDYAQRRPSKSFCSIIEVTPDSFWQIVSKLFPLFFFWMDVIDYRRAHFKSLLRKEKKRFFSIFSTFPFSTHLSQFLDNIPSSLLDAAVQKSARLMVDSSCRVWDNLTFFSFWKREKWFELRIAILHHQPRGSFFASGKSCSECKKAR